MDTPQTSPLAAFPNENKQAPHPIHSRPKKLLFIIFIIILVLILSISLQNVFLKDSKTTNKIPLDTKQSNTVLTANWNTYTNKAYGYDLQYEKDTTFNEANTTDYGYTELANGCMKVYVAPSSGINTLPEEKNGIPWKQLDDLKTLPIGQSRNCATLMFTFGPDGESVVDRNDYTRQQATKIAGKQWDTFTVKNANTTTVDKDTVYITEKNTYTYVIETKTGGSCPITPEKMLSTFTFTQ